MCRLIGCFTHHHLCSSAGHYTSYFWTAKGVVSCKNDEEVIFIMFHLFEVTQVRIKEVFSRRKDKSNV